MEYLMRLKQIIFFLMLIPLLVFAQKKDDKKDEKKDPINSGLISGLKLRNIGPAYCSGRIADFAVNPDDINQYYVAVASGNVWKTDNAGTTWKPIADTIGAYSIGVIKLDPTNSNVVWVGTGENNHQRALGYGSGVYKSLDGGQSWTNMGLKDSRQIGGIVIDPRNPNLVYVAAEGSVWGPGGERGLYKSNDGGKTWKRTLFVSENTGVNNVVMDPRFPDILYATTEQRRRHVFTKIGGGPESAVYKSVDGGETWNKLTKGIPSADKGGMGIAISPVNPDYVYLIIEAAEDEGGFFRSTNRGESWDKMSDYASSGQYYNEIYCDPKDVDKVVSVETVTKYTLDGGKTWKPLGNEYRHVDDHAFWVNPDNTNHFLIGGDGGIYESYDNGKTFEFKSNLPVTQFYRVNVDNDLPFYNVYGGTQDNSSMGGPSRTISEAGIVNSDWWVTQGGDGFWTAIDPKNPDIVYAESQYGGMVRYDRKSSEAIDIRPEPRKGEETYKWNWDTPLLISPHNNSRIYTAANKVFRSDDRGNTWDVISDDLTTQTDRNSFPVMDKFWSIDAVAKDVSTSPWGTIVSFAESPIKENVLFVGTDDGLIQVSSDAKTWNKIESFPGVPKMTYVSDIYPSRFDENIVFASFNNLKRDDFKPYLLKSSDKGKTWVSISGNLPANGSVHTIIQDFKNPDLLFVGTEFGLFFSVTGGDNWVQIKNGLPVQAVKDLAIQERESDLVLATFGRGFFVLDDYSPLRELNKDFVNKDAYIFPIKTGLTYIEKGSVYGQGHQLFKAPNPEFGVPFTYYIKDVPKTLKSIRKEKEEALFKEGKQIQQPSYAELKAEELENAPYLIFKIADQDGNIVRTINTAASKGIKRVVWDLAYESFYPVNVKENKFNPIAKENGSMLVLPGKYTVSMSLVTRDDVKEVVSKVPFEVDALNNTTLPTKDKVEMVAFQRKAAELARKVMGAENFTNELVKKMEYIKQAINNSTDATVGLMKKAEVTYKTLDEILFAFNGQKAKASLEELPPAQAPLGYRLNNLIYTQSRSTSDVTTTQKRSYEILSEEFAPVYSKIKDAATSIKELELELEKIKAQYTPGRLPELK